MRKFLIAGAAILALGTAPALAQNADADAAVVGGFTGALIGGSVAVSDDTVAYVGAHPVEPVVLNAPIEIGATLDNSVVVHEIPSDPQYGYIYTNNRVYIVDNASRQVVMSPGYAVPQSTVTYIEANPAPSVVIDGSVAAGYQLDPGVELVPVPDNSAYSYVYIDDRPALIDNSSRTVVWIK